MKRPARLFISYAREDAELRAQLETHLAALKSTGHVDVWSDSDLHPGETWEEKTNAQLDAADIVVLLVSADFYASHYAYEVETKRALEREKQSKTRVIPVVVRACQFEKTPLHKYHALPTNLKPVASWADRDEAWNDVVDGIRRVVEGRPIRGTTVPDPSSGLPSKSRWLIAAAVLVFGMVSVWAYRSFTNGPETTPTPPVPITTSPSASPSPPSASTQETPVPPPLSSQTIIVRDKAPPTVPPKPSAAAPSIRGGTATRNGNLWSLGVPVEALGGAAYVYLTPSPTPEALLGVRPTCSVLVGSATATCSRSDKAQSVDIGTQAGWSLP